MDVKVYPAKLKGNVSAPPSKSSAHRIFILSCLSDKKTFIKTGKLSDDLLATVNSLRNMGAKITEVSGGYEVYPIDKEGVEKVEIKAESSASTLRFLMPVATALYESVSFYGSKGLSKRPIKDLLYALRGVGFTSESLPLTVNGKLQAGEYRIAGGISSQYISGLLFALPLLDGDSKIIIEGKTVSSPYIGMTLHFMELFGVKVQKTDYGFFVEGNRKYISPESIEVEGDYSGASFFIALNEICGDITVCGLDEFTTQGDAKIKEFVKSIKTEKAPVISVKDNPDLLPVLCAYSCVFDKTVTFTDAGRLKLKESDRLLALYNLLDKVGIKAEEKQDEFIVHGSGIIDGGCMVDGYFDHRIVMAAVFLGIMAKAPITVLSADAVSKSYPSFFNDIIKLGGKVDVL